MSKARALRCAIYTRKSSEEGLEQDFNSLHAQREACEAFIKSQKHEGWSVVEAHYDDGGISGATMSRPALQRLLADIQSGQVDVVVVYKVDRLTRALSDFARIVDVFDAAGVSFVSVTQQFNTTTSMGRLTLNVLLSFAQFEREVTGERIRDKIAASRKKGMWMGGNPPLGYDVEERKLVVNEDEAETVRHIFRRYEELYSVRSLRDDLGADGIVGKVRVSRSGRCWGGRPLARGALYRMLRNRVYLGETVHKEKHYPGEHDAIVDLGLWERVQAKLDANRVEHKTGRTARNPSLLAGVLFDDNGDRMTPSHAVKNGKRYRYYISRPLTTQRKPTVPGGRRVPAGDIEQLVADRVRTLLSDQTQIFEAIRLSIQEPAVQRSLMERATELSRAWGDLPPADLRPILGALIARVDLLPEKVDIHLFPARLVDILQGNLADHPTTPESGEALDRLTLSVPARLKRAGMETKMIIDGADPDSRKAKPDASLIRLIVKAHALHEKLMAGNGASLGDISFSCSA
jgi:site-specific DNA recombinase